MYDSRAAGDLDLDIMQEVARLGEEAFALLVEWAWPGCRMQLALEFADYDAVNALFTRHGASIAVIAMHGLLLQLAGREWRKRRPSVEKNEDVLRRDSTLMPSLARARLDVAFSPAVTGATSSRIGNYRMYWVYDTRRYSWME